MGPLIWIPITLAQAVVFHLIVVVLLPRTAGWRSAKRLREFAGRTNVIAYRGLPIAGRRVLTANPDMATAFGVYDLENGPVRVHCVVPHGDRYWSLALYGWTTENFWAINDRTAEASEFDLVIVSGKGNSYHSRPDELVAVSPSRRGVIALRMIVNDRDDPNEQARVEQAIRKTMITSAGRVRVSQPVADRGISVCNS
jgi:uncharacterized membrane protein